jgi:redox-sensitive bicupin YhaK (pirin superfamily)
MSPSRVFEHDSVDGTTQLAYVFDGEAFLDPESKTVADQGTLAVFGKGRAVKVRAGDSGARFLLVSGEPLGEPIAWGGPIVMNTQDELDRAFEDLRQGTFIRKPSRS